MTRKILFIFIKKMVTSSKGVKADKMRNYGNKGFVVGERWLLLTVDDYRSPTAKRKAHSFFSMMRMMMMMLMMPLDDLLMMTMTTMMMMTIMMMIMTIRPIVSVTHIA